MSAFGCGFNRSTQHIHNTSQPASKIVAFLVHTVTPSAHRIRKETPVVWPSDRSLIPGWRANHRPFSGPVDNRL